MKNKFDYSKCDFYSNPVTDKMEELIKEVSSYVTEKRSNWVKEFVATLLKSNNVQIVEQQLPDARGYESRIVMNGKIVTSFRTTGIYNIEITRDAEFYKIERL